MLNQQNSEYSDFWKTKTTDTYAQSRPGLFYIYYILLTTPTNC